ncbi:hypothetical protein [Aliivibrio fischeri]|uniref:hypothetical protein n=1 Tax=Aliivibrio fischeri TaxID=668 RepID=UPI0007C59CC4|nr:hypothetical protein [Aliivibrio fischeri]MCE7575780.1 hypothetical protein [Aliivibrio fischeri]
MAQCLEINEQGFLYVSSNPVSQCTSLVALSIEEYNQSHAYVDFGDMSLLFTFSFSLVLFSYKAAWAVKVVAKAINII